MTSKSLSASVTDSLFRADHQRPPVPGCASSILSSELTTTTSKSFDLSHPLLPVPGSPQSTSLSVTSSTLHKPCLPLQPDGCTTTTAICSETSKPGASKMDSLLSLLNDSQGVTYFRQFLSTRRARDMLEFWLACVGYRKIDADKRSSFALVIYKTFIAPTSSRSCLAVPTRRGIRERLKTGNNVDHTMFDIAVAEVEAVLLRDYYPLFLESDDYAEYIRTQSANQSPSSCDGSSGHSSNCSQLVTVEEDDSRHCSDERLCKDKMPGQKPTACNQISTTRLNCTNHNCLAQTGYVFVVVLFSLKFRYSINTE